MKAFLAIKFYKDATNKELIKELYKVLEKSGFEPVSIVKDYEGFGKINFDPNKLMLKTFEVIDESEIVIIESSEKGVGIGIEAGYSFSKNKPIIVIAKKDSDISNTIKGIANKIIFYDNPEELIEEFKNINL